MEQQPTEPQEQTQTQEQPPKVMRTKKEKKPKAPVPPPVEYDPASYLDIRVGKIVHVQPHPDADKLYMEDIDIGDGVIKKVVTGVRQFIPIEKMQDRVVAVFCNIQPSKLKGQPSEAMVFAASITHGEEKEVVELLDIPEGTPIGTRILFGDFCQCDPSPCDKKYAKWKKVQPFCKINSDGVACYKDQPLHVAGGNITVATLKDCEFH